MNKDERRVEANWDSVAQQWTRGRERERERERENVEKENRDKKEREREGEIGRAHV